MKRTLFALALLVLPLKAVAEQGVIPDSRGRLSQSSAVAALGDLHVIPENINSIDRIATGSILVPKTTYLLTFKPHANYVNGTFSVHWEGATPVGGLPSSLTASASFREPGRHFVRLTVTFASGSVDRVERTFSADYEFVVLDVEPQEVTARIVYPSAEVARFPLDLDGDFQLGHGDLMRFWEAYGSNHASQLAPLADWDGDDSIGLRDLVPYFRAYEEHRGRVGLDYGNGNVYPVSIRSKGMFSFETPPPLLTVETSPPGLEGWVSWNLDGQALASGRILRQPITEPGSRRFSVDLFDRKALDSRDISIYAVRIRDLQSGRLLTSDRDILLDGVDYTLQAVTEPPGFEQYVTWLAATRYGTVSTSNGRGELFHVRFDATYGNDGSQWIGVQADNVYQNQDGKLDIGVELTHLHNTLTTSVSELVRLGPCAVAADSSGQVAATLPDAIQDLTEARDATAQAVSLIAGLPGLVRKAINFAAKDDLITLNSQLSEMDAALAAVQDYDCSCVRCTSFAHITYQQLCDLFNRLGVVLIVMGLTLLLIAAILNAIPGAQTVGVPLGNVATAIGGAGVIIALIGAIW